MNKYTLLHVSVFILVLLQLSCKKESKSDQLDGNVQFSFEVNTLNNGLTDNGNKAVAVIVTVEDLDGNILLNNERLDLFESNGNLISKAVMLAPGSYKLDKFMVVDQNGNTVQATPIGYSPKANLVDSPLPIAFDANASQISKVISKVASVAGFKPQDFGYASFSFNGEATFEFLVSVYVFNSSLQKFELSPAHLSISNESGASVVADLSATNNSVTVKEGRKYFLTISKEGYDAYNDSINVNDLLSFYSNPLVVLLDNDNDQRISFITVQDSLARLNISIVSTDDKDKLKVNWGDGALEIVSSNNKLVHDYKTKGKYLVSISGNISAFTSLEMMRCRLLSVNLKNATNLATIDVSRNQQLSFLDLSNMPNLKELMCVEGSIEKLNIVNSDSIQSLYCSSNKLKTLELLNLVNLKNLYCERNSITNLDISNNKKLEAFSCNQNKIEKLDVSNCVLLKTLNCTNNKLTYVDITKNSSINFIDMGHNDMSTGMATKVFTELLTNVQSNPRKGYINIPQQPMDIQAAIDLEKKYSWTVNYR